MRIHQEYCPTRTVDGSINFRRVAIIYSVQHHPFIRTSKIHFCLGANVELLPRDYAFVTGQLDVHLRPAIIQGLAYYILLFYIILNRSELRQRCLRHLCPSNRCGHTHRSRNRSCQKSQLLLPILCNASHPEKLPSFRFSCVYPRGTLPLIIPQKNTKTTPQPKKPPNSCQA